MRRDHDYVVKVLVLKDAPEYLLNIVSQVTEALLSKINVPDREIEKVSEQIKKRHMGKLFANYEPYDVHSSDLTELYQISVEKALKAVELYW